MSSSVILTDDEVAVLRRIAQCTNRMEAKAPGGWTDIVVDGVRMGVGWVTEEDFPPKVDRLIALGLVDVVHSTNYWGDQAAYWQVSEAGLTAIRTHLGKDGPYIVRTITAHASGSPASFVSSDVITGVGQGSCVLYGWSDGVVTWTRER